MRVDENRAQAFDAEAFDETHAAHVGGEVIDFHRAFADALAVVLVAHVEAEVLHAGHMQIPLVKRLLVHRADVGETLLLEIKGEVAGDESARAGDDDQIVLLQRGVLFHDAFLLLHKYVFRLALALSLTIIGSSIVNATKIPSTGQRWNGYSWPVHGYY